MLFRLRVFTESLLVPWFPAVCARCGAEGGSPCVSCSEEFSPAHELGDISDLDIVVGLVAYDEVSRPFIADLKYRGKWATARAFAPALAILLDDCIGGERPGPVLTWAPTTPDRARDRGFDQAEVIGTRVEATSRLACAPTSRPRAGPAANRQEPQGAVSRHRLSPTDGGQGCSRHLR